MLHNPLYGLYVNVADTSGCRSDIRAMQLSFLLPTRSPILLGMSPSPCDLRGGPDPSAWGGGGEEDDWAKPVVMVPCLLPEIGSGIDMCYFAGK